MPRKRTVCERASSASTAIRSTARISEGCVNDVKDLSAALVTYNFSGKDITVLTDDAATKKAMEAGIKALVRDSKKGDVAVLHSGRGSNVPGSTTTG